MDDRIRDRIEQLVSQEHELRQREAGGSATVNDHYRHLLRQGHARCEADLDADAAYVRDAVVLEGYEQ